jgi:hypothetical protein
MVWKEMLVACLKVLSHTVKGLKKIKQKLKIVVLQAEIQTQDLSKAKENHSVMTFCLKRVVSFESV